MLARSRRGNDNVQRRHGREVPKIGLEGSRRTTTERQH
jgi:hypothetical protein